MPDASNPVSLVFVSGVALGAGVEVDALQSTTFRLSGVRAGQKITFVGHYEVLQGAGTGNCTLRVRRTNLTGAQVGAYAGPIVSLAIAERKTMTIVVSDVAPSDDPVYDLTIQDSTAATLEEAALLAFVSN